MALPELVPAEKRDDLPDAQQQIMEQLGGPKGLVYSALPTVAFVAGNAAWSLRPAITVALAVALAITGWRLLHREPVRPALSGLLGVVVAAGVAAWTGSANGWFLMGIWSALAVFVALVISLLVRRPLTGLLWNALHGNKYDWRADRTVRRAHIVATTVLAVLTGSRFAVQQWLLAAEETGWLATAKIVMGTPLLIPAVLVVVWAFRRSTTSLGPST